MKNSSFSVAEAEHGMAQYNRPSKNTRRTVNNFREIPKAKKGYWHPDKKCVCQKTKWDFTTDGNGSTLAFCLNCGRLSPFQNFHPIWSLGLMLDVPNFVGSYWTQKMSKEFLPSLDS